MSLSQITLDRSLCIVVAESEPFGVQRAARTLAQDVQEAGGFLPGVVHHRPRAAAGALIVESQGTIAGKEGFARDLEPEESFIIRAIRYQGQAAILISSRNELGAIHGVYHFSEKHLGTDPFKLWTGYRPSPRDPIVLGAVDYTSGPPAFRFRGWHVEGIWIFPQDWDAVDGDSIIRAYWEAVFETLLRCQGNMVKPETNVPDSPEVALAQKMGLWVTQEHYCPFGVKMWEIKSDDPAFNYSFDRYADVYMKAWEAAIGRYPRPERVIWTLAFRGRGDRPFWESDPSYDTDTKRGALITRVLRQQMDLIQRRLGRQNPPVIFNTWMEGNRLLVNGHIQVPEGTHVVWADNGYGTFRSMIAEGCEPEQVGATLPAQPTGGQQGVYYHVSMWDFQAPFLTQFVPLERIQRQFMRAMEKQTTAYLLVNVGRVRDCVYSAGAMADLWQNPQRWVDPSYRGEDRRPQGFRREWCVRHFSPFADEAQRCYDDLCRIPFQWGEWGGWDDYTVGDVGYVRRAVTFVRETLCPSVRSSDGLPRKFWLNRDLPLSEQMAYVRSNTRSAAPRWEQARTLALAVAGKLEGAARSFFECDVLSQIEIHAFLNSYLQHMIDAVSLYEQGRFEDVPEKARAAIQCVDKVRAALRRREYGRWRHWNTPKLLYNACLPLARHAAELIMDVSERVSTRQPNFTLGWGADEPVLPDSLK